MSKQNKLQGSSFKLKLHKNTLMSLSINVKHKTQTQTHLTVKNISNVTINIEFIHVNLYLIFH